MEALLIIKRAQYVKCGVSLPTFFFSLEHAGKLHIFVLRGKRGGPITEDSTSPWARVRAA
jgi:hypothetical protein